MTQCSVSLSFNSYPGGEGVVVSVMVTEASTGTPVTGLFGDNFLFYACYPLDAGSGSAFHAVTAFFTGEVVNFGPRLPGVYLFDLNFDPKPLAGSVAPYAYPFAVAVLGTIFGETVPIAVVGVGTNTFYSSASPY
jgi:hypothetical protein